MFVQSSHRGAIADFAGLPNLDLLRAFAVSLVFLDHTLLYLVAGGDHLARWPLSPLAIGRFGVLLFFVHTCLVLLLSMSRGSQTGGLAAEAARFYVRRVFRIYPLASAVILLTLLAHVPAAPNETFLTAGWPAIVSNLLLIQNITHARDIVGPLWSLPYEVEMYLALPFLFCLTKGTRGLVWIGVVYAAVVAASLGGPSIGLRGAYLLEFVPCFFGGILAYVILRYDPVRRLPWWLWFTFVVLIGAIFVAVSPGTEQSHYFKEWIGCLLIGGSLPFAVQVAFRPLVFVANRIAEYSYSVYLLHLPAMWVVLLFAREWPLFAKVGLSLMLTAVFSAFAYHLIEKPIQQLGRRIAFARPAAQPRVLADVH